MTQPISRSATACLPLAGALLGACSLLPTAVPQTPQSADCRAQYAAVDAQVDAAGVRDARYHRVPGYPYLRSDRFVASFADRSAVESGRSRDWILALQDLDRDARHFELSNLGLSEQAHDALLEKLHDCAELLSGLELSSPPARERLAEAVRVPDDYSTAGRVFGLYPLALPFLKLGIAGYHRKLHRDYATPLDQLSGPSTTTLWQARARTRTQSDPNTIDLGQVGRDGLGRIALSEAASAALAAAHAPAWWIESGGDYDRPGTPVLGVGGPGLDLSRPVVHYQLGYTRFEGQTLLQLNYLVWFRERPATRWADPYAGALDGIVWRVTLDGAGRPLAYDTIHACGCYHYWFPRPGLQRQAVDRFWQEATLFPQAEIPAEPFAVRVQSGTHYVRRLVDRAAVTATQTQEYELRPYEELLSLPHPAGPPRSLFGIDGIVSGTERGERWWLWPSGVRNPGAMRVLGRHATAFVGRQHFDDPSLLDRLFRATPARASSP